MLHIGSNDPRDDTATAIAARAHGAGASRSSSRAAANGAAPDGVEYVGRVSDERLVELYQGAAAFLDTSLYEGFGYQVLEAMACGTPVVASRATSLPELVGDAGLLCPPGDAAAFADALRRRARRSGARAQLRERGLERARSSRGSAPRAQLADAIDGGVVVIALVHGLRNWGAVEEYVAAVARGLAERGATVVLVHPDDPALAPFDALGVRTVRVRPRLAPVLTRALVATLRAAAAATSCT